MEMVANSPKMAKKVGVPQSVGKDFEEADRGKKFSRGGQNSAQLQVINKKKTNHGAAALFKGGGMATSAKMKMQKDMKKEFPQGISKKGAMPESKSMGMMGMKKGGATCAPKKMADGGGAYVGSRLNMPSNTRLGKLSASDTKDVNRYDSSESGKEQAAARKEGIVAKRTKMQDMGIANKASDAMPGSEYKKGGMTKRGKSSCYAKGGGIESKGKTKGRMC